MSYWLSALWTTIFGLSTTISPHASADLVAAANLVITPSISAPQVLAGIASSVATLLIASLFTDTGALGIDRTPSRFSFGERGQVRARSPSNLIFLRR